MTMHRLMRTSPVVDRSAIAHSTTPLDLSVLDNIHGQNTEVDMSDFRKADTDTESRHGDIPKVHTFNGGPFSELDSQS